MKYKDLQVCRYNDKQGAIYMSKRKAIINFISKDIEADVIGYLNFAPARNTDKQHEIFCDRYNQHKCMVRYEGKIKPLEPHLTVESNYKVAEVLWLTDWRVNPSYVAIDIINWDESIS